MVLAYHAIFGTYGFWLPNDPRGSWSDFVWSWELQRFGKATTVNVRRSVARATHDAAARRAAKRALKYAPVVFTGRQALAVAQGFGEACQESGYRVWAASILPEHVHLVVGRGGRKIEQVVAHLKGRATQALLAAELHDADRPVWAKNCWKVFLNSPADIRRAIRYVVDNPLKERKRRQTWSFVTPYDGSPSDESDGQTV